MIRFAYLLTSFIHDISFPTHIISFSIQIIEKHQTRKEILSIGLACSECFSGPRLAQLLQPGFEYEQQVMMDLMAGKPAPPLSIHTSGGVPAALSTFIDTLEPHLPWKGKELDWCLSLQLEGASAVWAGIDMLLQLQIMKGQVHRKMVAVGGKSYHGPPSTSFGSSCPLFSKHSQLTYPVPVAGQDINEKDLLDQYEQFLNEYATCIGVLLIEPQWGSSQVALSWPEGLAKKYIKMAQERGILVLADEIMCGLGRHGKGTLFLSEAWQLDPDAVTFGKAIGGGVFPLSGVVIKVKHLVFFFVELKIGYLFLISFFQTGGALLGCHNRTVMQSHTFSGSSIRSLMTATEVLKTLPQWFDSIKKCGDEMKVIFRHLEKISNGLIYAQGQGLMWGALVSREGMHSDEDTRSRSVDCLKRNFDEVGVLPYFVPVGGFMISPVVDIDVGTLYKIAERIEKALVQTVEEVGWTQPAHAKVEIRLSLQLDEEFCASEARKQCLTNLHLTKTCTSCSDFVSPMLRKRFSSGLWELHKSCGVI